MHIRAFSQPIIILSNYDDATKLMYEAKYSGRPQNVMLNELYVYYDSMDVADLVLI